MKNTTTCERQTRQPIKPKQRLSIEDARFFAKQLSELVNHPRIPEALQEGILDGIEALENQVRICSIHPYVIEHALLAYATDGFEAGIEQITTQQPEGGDV